MGTDSGSSISSQPSSSRNDTEKHENQQLALTKRKGIHFALAFTALSVVAFTSALDATILAIALPVC